MFKTQTCIQCFIPYEYYQKGTVVPDCPVCGARGGYDKPLTSEEYYLSMGVKTRTAPLDKFSIEK